MRVARCSPSEVVLVEYRGASFDKVGLYSGLFLFVPALVALVYGIVVDHVILRTIGWGTIALLPEIMALAKRRKTWRFHRGTLTTIERPVPYVLATRRTRPLAGYETAIAPNPRYLDLCHSGRRVESLGLASAEEAARVRAALDAMLSAGITTTARAAESPPPR